MINQAEAPAVEGRLGGCVMWFFWGVSLSFMAILSLALLILLAASVSLNVYLGWELAGLEVSVSRSGGNQLPELIPTDMLVVIPTNTPVLPVTPTATPLPTISPLEVQVATLSALATQVAVSQPPATSLPLASLPVTTPAALSTRVSTAVAISTPLANTPQPANPIAPAATVPPPATTAPPATPASVAAAPQQEAAAEFEAPKTSSNVYSLIALEGQRESRPAEEHGDLNLKLRDPQPIDVDLSLQDIPGSGIDSNAPNLGAVFKNPQFVRAYTIHDWDWGCNCKGKLINDDHLVLVGIKTTPGQPIFIPTKKQDIFGGKFYATLLYASEDSLTFVYSREGNVAHAYSVHYLGLRTDPNLLALYRQSKGNELPGLTLDTPVGVATNELIVAIRDKGKFMDARSRGDWWK
jgi:hypothetical protein